MIWLDLLRRFWKPLAGAALLIGSGWYLHHTGYESGYAASEAHWQPLFATAERERDAANERARRTEESSRSLSGQIEKQHAETIASLNLRAADADQRIRALSVRLAAARTGRCPMPAVPGAPAVPDATPAGAERAEGAGASISDTGRRCELDAATLADLQNWVMAQRRISEQP